MCLDGNWSQNVCDNTVFCYRNYDTVNIYQGQLTKANCNAFRRSKPNVTVCSIDLTESTSQK